MGPSKPGKGSNTRNVLKIRAEADLPIHKRAAALDDLDRDILEMHQKDVFFSYNDLAEKWDVTVATIRNRIKRLKKAGVMDVILVLNPYKIGYDTFATIGVKLETGADLGHIFVEYVCQNMEDYRKFVGERLRAIPGVANIESFIGLDLYERKFELGIIH
jgi:DNA-binding Lrp family transcriptional regulator